LTWSGCFPFFFSLPPSVRALRHHSSMYSTCSICALVSHRLRVHPCQIGPPRPGSELRLYVPSITSCRRDSFISSTVPGPIELSVLSRLRYLAGRGRKCPLRKIFAKYSSPGPNIWGPCGRDLSGCKAWCFMRPVQCPVPIFMIGPNLAPPA